MKQKSSSSQLITKKYLEKTLDERFVAFEKKVDEKLFIWEARTDIKRDNLERKIDEKAQQYRDQILTSNDKLAKTLETMREDLEIGNFQTREKLEDHEKRINILESA